ncbi:MAG TPA: prepilin-type N-terminal cleavage/methylation domain-containing protein [Candidatus Paceibacterota bacterium]|nr:prepilin-type N-terminal cleavage/methylation domain-containing protein [Candidatus Paceibacterota bacterium]HOL53987.1 prepilin-type N-terminal cleavage/methylation domain-containing protein [Candidatus Paceibacterota bacterium]HON22061.1 prepilin-type N-terminal cleavage/methylation domain-containing protein [Candidatus Paceibacterota bacterium]HPP17159.1 prepilin-type N-terminal cleavage/methylation domain-containing protein [Candidatus Paceibacterota bacterium]
MKNQRAKNNKGFSLVEVMVSIGVILVGFTGALTLINRSIAFHDLAYSRLTASYLAQEGIEIVRNLRDENIIKNQEWNYGLKSGTYQVQYNSSSLSAYTGENLLLDSVSGVYTYDANENTRETRYNRRIEIQVISPDSLDSSDEIRVISIVRWSNRGGDFEIRVEDHLFNWL